MALQDLFRCEISANQPTTCHRITNTSSIQTGGSRIMRAKGGAPIPSSRIIA